MYTPKVHLFHHMRADHGIYAHALCRRVTDRWTRDPDAVTCQACKDAMDLQPS